MHEKVVRILLEARENISRTYDRAAKSVRQYDRDIDNLSKDLDRNEKSTRGLAGAMRTLRGETDNTRSSIRGLSGELRGLLFLGVIAFAQDLASVLDGLAGSLLSVASSASIAAGGLAGLAAAGVAQVVPAVAVMVGAFKEVASVFQLVQTSQKQAIKSGTEHQEQLVDQREAMLRVVDAARQLEESEKGLKEARNEAKRELRDLVLAEREADLAARRSSLSLSEARENLQSLVGRGASANEIESAQIGVREAEEQRDKSRLERTRSHNRLKTAERRGVQNNPGVIQAQNQLRASTEALTQARRAAQKATEGQAGAERLLQAELERLTPIEKKLFHALKDFSNTSRELLRPIADHVVGAFTLGIVRTEELFKSARGKRLLGVFDELSRSESDGIRQIIDHMLSDDVLKRLEEFTRGAAENIKPLTSATISIFDTFGNIAHAAMPVFKEATILFAGWAANLEKSSENTDGLRSFFREGLEQFRAWAKLGGAVLDIFGTLSEEGGAETGKRTVEDLTSTIEKANSKLKENAADVRKFFDESRRSTSALGSVLARIGQAFLEVFDADRVEDLAKTINNTLIPALVIATQLMGTITNLVVRFLDIPVINDVAKWAIGIVIFVAALNKLTAVIDRFFVETAVRFGTAIAGITRDIKEFIIATRAVGFLKAFETFFPRMSVFIKNFRSQLILLGIGLALLIVQLIGVQNIMHALGDVISSVANFLSDLLGVSKQVGTALALIGFAALVGAILAVVNAVYGLTNAFLALKAAAISNPFTAIAVVLGTAATAIGLFNTGQEETVKQSRKATEAFKEQTEALRELEGIKRGVEEAKTSVQRARLNQIAAEEQLDKAKKKGDKREVQEAKLSLKEAINQRERAEEELRHTREDAPRERQEQKVRARESLRELEENRQGTKERLAGFRGRIQSAREKISFAREHGLLGRPETPGGQEAKDAYRDLRAATNELAKEKEHLADVEAKIAEAQGNAARAAGRLGNKTEDAAEATKKFWHTLDNVKGPARDAGQGIESAKNKTRDLLQLLPEIKPAAHKASKGFRAAGESAANLGGTVGGVSTAIAEFLNKGLRSFGAKPLDWDGRIDGGKVKASSGAVKSLFNMLTPLGGGFAGGGFVGKMGERGADTVHAMLGRGEAVLNWAHQKLVDPALRAFYGFGLGDMFGRTNAMHGASAGSGFAGGGMVDPSWDPGSEVLSQAISGIVGRWARKYGADMTAGYNPGGSHVSPGHNVTGTATDMVPRGGWSAANTKRFEAGLRFLVGKGFEVLYDGHAGTVPYPNHGRYNHAHIEWVGNGTAMDALAGLGGMRGFGRLKKPQIRGPKGPLRNIALGAAQTLTQAANRYLGRKGTGGLGDRMGAVAKGPWVQVMKRIAAAQHWNFGDWWKLVMAESGGDPTAVNPSSGAFGLGQFLGSTLDAYRKYGAGSHNPAKQIFAMAKYIKDRYVTPTAAWAFHQANNWYARGGFTPGGRMIEAHDGEMVLTPEQQDVLGGNGFLSKLFGFGRSRDKTSFDGGGNVGEKKGSKTPPTGALGSNVTIWTRPARNAIEKIIRESINTLEDLPRSLYESVIRGKHRVMVSTQKRWQEGMQALGNQISSLAEEIGKRAARARTEILRNTYKLVNGRVIQAHPRGIVTAQENVRTLREERRGLQKERKLAKAGERAGEKRVDQTTKQLKSLRKKLADADSKHDRKVIEKKIKDLEEARQSARGVAQNFRNSVEEVNEAIANNIAEQYAAEQELFEKRLEATFPAHRQAMLQLRQQATEFFLGFSASTQQKLAIDQERGSALAQQRAGLLNMLSEAQSIGNVEQVERLQEALEENRIATLENVKEMHDLRMSATFSPHEQSMLSLRKQLAELSGESFSSNIAELIVINMQRQSALQKQATEFGGMFAEALSEGNMQWQEELEEAMLENRIAILENTKELQELNGTLGAPQEFTTTAWTLFRKAVFDGMGGLLPQFQVPALASGGMITKTGLFQLHAGEAVLRADEQRGGHTVNVEVNQAGQDLDPNYLAKRLSFEMKTRTF